MKIRQSFFLTVLLSFLISLNISAQKEFYVSPDGNDLHSGTMEQPLASLNGARDAIRKYRSGKTPSESVTVIITGGFYQMNKPLILTDIDGGTPEFPVVYKAAGGTRPVFSGGKKIDGFKENSDGIWEVKIPAGIMQNKRFDQLYVNGKRAVLARTPNNGFLKIDHVKEKILEKGSGRVPEKARQKFYFKENDLKFLHLLDKKDLKHIRFRTYHNWDFTLKNIDEIKKNVVLSSGQGMKPWNPVKKGGRITFENFMAALDAPGEWYLSDNGILFYKPLPGQTPENTEIIVPVLENLISIEGNASNNKYVEYIRFEGISFRHGLYRFPQTGFEPNQAAVSINAAVELKGARNISFINCEVIKTGQHAVWIGKGCSNCSVEHCYLKDLGGGGIYLGDVKPLEGEEHTHHIVLDNNIIQTGGREFPPAVGIWVGHSSDNTITHNDIGDFYYTGISVGWIWGYKPSLAKRNMITQNHIHHIGWDLLSDMAAVYTLGRSEGTQISNNVIHHVHAYSYGGWGLYPDEGTTGIVMENNLVYSTKTGGFHQHYGKENSIKNNIFAYAKLFQVQCTRVEDHRSFDFDHNIVVFDQGVVLKGSWDKIDIHMDQNLYWNTAGGEYIFNGVSFEKWQETGHDKNSFIADPGFVNAPEFDFRFKDKKNIQKINFIPFDYSKAGVYGDREWKEKAKLPVQTLKEFDEVVKKNTAENNLK
jgi:hypothetical protein